MGQDDLERVLVKLLIIHASYDILIVHERFYYNPAVATISTDVLQFKHGNNTFLLIQWKVCILKKLYFV